MIRVLPSAQGAIAGRDRIARLRRELNLRCKQKRKWSVFGAVVKNGLIHHPRYATRADAKAAIQEYAESLYSRQRRHSHLG